MEMAGFSSRQLLSFGCSVSHLSVPFFLFLLLPHLLLLPDALPSLTIPVVGAFVALQLPDIAPLLQHAACYPGSDQLRLQAGLV